MGGRGPNTGATSAVSPGGSAGSQSSQDMHRGCRGHRRRLYPPRHSASPLDQLQLSKHTPELWRGRSTRGPALSRHPARACSTRLRRCLDAPSIRVESWLLPAAATAQQAGECLRPAGRPGRVRSPALSWSSHGCGEHLGSEAAGGSSVSKSQNKQTQKTKTLGSKVVFQEMIY